LYMRIWLLGALPPGPLGLCPEPRWGTSIPHIPVPTKPPNPGYATGFTSGNHSVWLSSSECGREEANQLSTIALFSISAINCNHEELVKS